MQTFRVSTYFLGSAATSALDGQAQSIEKKNRVKSGQKL